MRAFLLRLAAIAFVCALLGAPIGTVATAKQASRSTVFVRWLIHNQRAYKTELALERGWKGAVQADADYYSDPEYLAWQAARWRVEQFILRPGDPGYELRSLRP